MAGERRALLVATDVYADSGLQKLRAPTGDVLALAEVLADPTIGGFDVRQLVNQPTDDIKQEIEGFFDEARLHDLLLLYMSGHGVLSQARRLYFATATTKLRRLRATAIEDGFVHDVMQHSRARSIVLALDCCHSGAFGKGLAPKSALSVEVAQRFEGHGHVTLTASSEVEYAFELGEAEASISDLGASAPGSLFTRCLVEGLKTGDADVDQDGVVSIDELYDYVYERVRQCSRHQTPGKSGAGHGDIYIAANPHRCTLLNEVRATIDQALEHPWPAVREAAVAELTRLRSDADPALAAAIKEALQRAVNDDNRSVSTAAHDSLGADPTIVPALPPHTSDPEPSANAATLGPESSAQPQSQASRPTRLFRPPNASPLTPQKVARQLGVLMLRKERAALFAALEQGERIYHVVAPDRGVGGVLALTDRRLIFLRKAPMTTVEWTLVDVTKAHVETTLMGARLQIHLSNGTVTEFGFSVDKRNPVIFAQLLTDALQADQWTSQRARDEPGLQM